MISKKLILLIAVALYSQCAWASSDNYCSPTWSLVRRGYDRCNNLPILTPGNDTRINLKLLMVDAGLGTMQTAQVSKEDRAFGYGKVPFSLEFFETSIFSARNSATHAPAENNAVSYGTANRCSSNEGGKSDFIAAVEQNKALSAAERQDLGEARKKLTPGCAVGKASAPSGGDTHGSAAGSAAYQQFMGYLDGAAAFYEGRYDAAATAFAQLGRSDQPWLREAAQYMAGRTELNRAQQQAFDEYGFPQLDKVDKKALLAAEAQLARYLQAYPAGQYAASARGLLRRVYWLSKQHQKLADEYAWLLHHLEAPQSNLSADELALEVDSKLLTSATPDQVKHPLLLATLDLLLMRNSDSAGTKPLSLADLEKQQPLFAKHTALYEYLRAVHLLYVQNDALSALKRLPDNIPPQMTYLDFSRLVLRGQALEASGDYPGARSLWRALLQAARQPLQNETIQLALALNYEYSKQPALAFAPDSPITEPAIRSVLLRNSIAAADLRQIISRKTGSGQERQNALYTLLYKELLQGQYKDYLQDHALLPADAAQYDRNPGMDYGENQQLSLFLWVGKKTDDSYSCSSTVEIAKKLAHNPKDPVGLLCLGDFANANDLASGPDVTNATKARKSGLQDALLGAAPSRFPGTLFSRGEGYKAVIADAGATPDQNAYALYRLIKCYATSGYNHCGGKNVGLPERKAWFRILKSRYAGSVWAQSLKYYW